jgi:hypothetical protein
LSHGVQPPWNILVRDSASFSSAGPNVPAAHHACANRQNIRSRRSLHRRAGLDAHRLIAVGG